MKKIKFGDSISANDKEVHAMPAIELVECERAAYVKRMEEYLKKLRAMPDGEAIKKSRINLENCNIIHEDGEFAERYSYSRMYNSGHRG